MPCVSLKHNRDYKASLKQAKILAEKQLSEQKIAQKAAEMPQNSEKAKAEATPTTAPATTTKPKNSKLKALVAQKKAKLAAKKITYRAAKAERKAARSSKLAAKKAAAQSVAGAAKASAKAAGAATTATTSASAGAKITEQTLKIPHQHTKATAKTVAKPAKLTPKTDIPGMISTATVKKATGAARPMPSTIFKRRSNAKPTRADLINAESRLGSQLFGAIPAGHRREFFHDQKNIWIWHEDWIDEAEHEHQLTIRYEIRTSGVYKKVAAGKYFKLEGDELENFRKATHAYLYVIKKYLYNHPYSKAVA